MKNSQKNQTETHFQKPVERQDFPNSPGAVLKTR